MSNIIKSDIPCIVGHAIDTQEQIIKEICGSGVKDLYYSATHSVWIVEFRNSKDMTFDDFDSMYQFLTTEDLD